MEYLEVINHIEEFYKNSWERLLWFVTAIAAIGTFVLGYVVPSIQKKQLLQQKRELQKKYKKGLKKLENTLKKDFEGLKLEYEDKLNDKISEIEDSLEIQEIQSNYYVMLTNSIVFGNAKDYASALDMAVLAIEYAIKLKDKVKLENAITAGTIKLVKKDVLEVFPSLEEFIKYSIKMEKYCEDDEDLIKAFEIFRNQINKIL